MKPDITILGAGPAGLGAAYKLAVSRSARVTVLEQNNQVGGNAGSFSLEGMPVDYGSHRLHPACDPEILQDIRLMLGEDLLDRPRHGRIRLRGRWIHFPLKPMDLALRLPPAFSAGVAMDIAGKVFHRGGATQGDESFASVMVKDLGSTICRDFYFPYARKIWGLEPEILSSVQARRRVSNNSLGKMVRKVLSAIPGLKSKGSGRFFYPRNGYGQISEAYCQAALQAGAEILLNTRVKAVELDDTGKPQVHYEQDGRLVTSGSDYLWSTIPVTVLARMFRPEPPAQLIQAAQAMEYRAMILIYLVLEQDRFSEYDAHYFPEQSIPITRLSEPKNYRAGEGPLNRTILCAELPCQADGAEWKMSDQALGELVRQSLDQAGIPIQAPVMQVHARRLRFAYPIYRRGYEKHFGLLDEWFSKFEKVLIFGRQGLFAHDNTHHALYMAYSAASCLDSEGSFDRNMWQQYRRIFESHVVED